jgi:hypothetical protein
LLWEAKLGSRISGPPLVNAGRLVLVTDNGRFLLLDATSGEFQSDISLGGAPIAGVTLHGPHLIVPLGSGTTEPAVMQIDLTRINPTD